MTSAKETLEGTAGASPEATGGSRAVVAGMVMTPINLVLLFLPLDAELKAALYTTVNPLMLGVSFIVYGLWDRKLGKLIEAGQ